MRKQTEYYIENKDSDKLVVFIHGIVEGTNQFRNLAKIAYRNGYSAYVILLPGHGGTSEDFQKTSYHEWVYAVGYKMQVLKEMYSEIILVGHSMGSLIAICEAIFMPSKITKLVLIDTPLNIRVSRKVIKSSLNILLGNVNDEYTKMQQDAMAVSIDHSMAYFRWIKRYLELFSLIRFTKKHVAKLNKEMLLVFASKDEFVDLISLKYFKRIQKLLVLKHSGHFAYNPKDMKILEREFKKFLIAPATNELSLIHI